MTDVAVVTGANRGIGLVRMHVPLHLALLIHFPGHLAASHEPFGLRHLRAVSVAPLEERVQPGAVVGAWQALGHTDLAAWLCDWTVGWRLAVGLVPALEPLRRDGDLHHLVRQEV